MAATLSPNYHRRVIDDVLTELTTVGLKDINPVTRMDGHLHLLGEGVQRVDAGFGLGLHHRYGAFSQVSAGKINRIEGRELTVYAKNSSYESHMSDVQTNQVMASEHPLSTDAWVWRVRNARAC